MAFISSFSRDRDDLRHHRSNWRGGRRNQTHPSVSSEEEEPLRVVYDGSLPSSSNRMTSDQGSSSQQNSLSRAFYNGPLELEAGRGQVDQEAAVTPAGPEAAANPVASAIAAGASSSKHGLPSHSQQQLYQPSRFASVHKNASSRRLSSQNVASVVQMYRQPPKNAALEKQSQQRKQRGRSESDILASMEMERRQRDNPLGMLLLPSTRGPLAQPPPPPSLGPPISPASKFRSEWVLTPGGQCHIYESLETPGRKKPGIKSASVTAPATTSRSVRPPQNVYYSSTTADSSPWNNNATTTNSGETDSTSDYSFHHERPPSLAAGVTTRFVQQQRRVANSPKSSVAAKKMSSIMRNNRRGSCEAVSSSTSSTAKSHAVKPRFHQSQTELFNHSHSLKESDRKLSKSSNDVEDLRMSAAGPFMDSLTIKMTLQQKDRASPGAASTLRSSQPLPSQLGGGTAPASAAPARAGAAPSIPSPRKAPLSSSSSSASSTDKKQAAKKEMLRQQLLKQHQMLQRQNKMRNGPLSSTSSNSSYEPDRRPRRDPNLASSQTSLHELTKRSRQLAHSSTDYLNQIIVGEDDDADGVMAADKAAMRSVMAPPGRRQQQQSSVFEVDV